MAEPAFQGISLSDMKYLDYIAKNAFHGPIELCLETDLSAEYRLNKLKEEGYIIIKNNNIHFSFKAIAALTDYRNYLAHEEKIARKEFIRHWVPIAINALLSTIAIIISIIALLN